MLLAVGVGAPQRRGTVTLNDKRFRISGSINSITMGGDNVLA